MIQTEVKTDTSYLDRLKKEIEIAKKLTLKVGLPKDVGFYPKKESTDKPISVLLVGAKHEFGSPEDGTPQRSFLRLTVIKNRKLINNMLKKGFTNVLDGNASAVTTMNKIGLLNQQLVQKTIKSQGFGQWEKLKQETVEKKGDDQILVNTSRLFQSITYWVDKK